MLRVTAQDKNVYDIEYFHLDNLPDGTYEMKGLAIYNLNDKELVHLGFYKYYRQAITVFAQMDYKANELVYMRKRKKRYTMPENILDEQVCINIYGSTY